MKEQYPNGERRWREIHAQVAYEQELAHEAEARRNAPPGRDLSELLRGSVEDALRRLDPLAPNQRTAVTTGTGIGQGLVPQEVADRVLDLAADYGVALRLCSVVRVNTGRVKVGKITARPQAVWISAANQATQIGDDALLVGGAASMEARDLAAKVNIAIPAIEDGTILTPAIETALGQAFAGAIDWAFLSAAGADDVVDGAQTGIFASADVPSVTAAGGKVSTETLAEEDFLRTIDACANTALQRGARWFVHPAIYKKLLRVRDGSGADLVKLQNGEPYLCSFPVTLAAAAPSTNAASQKVLGFGCPQAYLIIQRRQIEVLLSDAVMFDRNLRQMRAVMRAHGEILDATWFSTLKLSAG